MRDGAAPSIRYPHETPPAEGEAIEVAEDVLWMRLPLPMRLDHVNCYVLRDPDGWTIVDTGFATSRSRGVWERILSGPLDGLPVARVVVTHHHPDHIGLAGWFQSRGATLLTTRTAWLYARMLTLDVQEQAPAEQIAFLERAGMEPSILARRRVDRPLNYADVVAPLPVGFHRLKQGDRITAAGRDWDVHLGGGHAPDHLTLWSRDDGLVIGGDQLLPSISPNLGVYATEPEADPVSDWLESCERFLKIARPDQLVLPGHKLPFIGLPARLRQLIDNHHGALDRLMAHLLTPRRGGDCFLPLFRRTIGEGEYGLALAETIAHLNHLHQTGRIRRWRDSDGAWLWQR